MRQADQPPQDKVMDPAFALVMSKLRAGDEDAANEVFRRFVHRLIGLASRQFDTRVRSKEDPEDVVNSVYKSFFRRNDRSPYDLADWDGLWALLATITVRKCGKRREFWQADRRDVDRETAPSPGLSDEDWREAVDQGPTPYQATVLAETVEHLIRPLEPAQRKIAELFFQGYTSLEISDRCDCSERTVRRVITRVREALRLLEADDREI